MMLGLLEALAGYISVPAWVIVALLLLFLVSQVVGEVIELCGKVAPGFMKLRKMGQEKREKIRLQEEKERQRDEKMAEMTAALERSNAVIEKFEAHYSEENIEKRDCWMHDVDDDRKEYHVYREESRQDRASLHGEIAVLAEKLEKNTEITLGMLIETKRAAIINFASKVADSNVLTTHEEFRRIFKTYDEYEAIIEENHMTNGEVDVSIRIIREAYADRLKRHAFVEDARGYES